MPTTQVFFLFQEGGALKSGPDGKTDLAFHLFNQLLWGNNSFNDML